MRGIVLASLGLCLVLAPQGGIAAESNNRLVVNADQGTVAISRHIYGHFSEHLGRCIYGGVWVGEDSPIPNTRGIRKDVVEALRRIQVPNLRWPGGCFADTYHWKDGIGPRERRPTIVNVHWGGVTENNHFGTHEFLDFCEQIGAEPYICGNVGSGSVQEMAEWVEYLTFDGKSPMTDLRAQNGRAQPWKVSLWAVGNENWGCGGSMRPEYYADAYRQFRTYLRNYGGNRLFRVSCGPSDDNQQWTEVLMREAGRMMEGLALHYYTVDNWRNKGSATEFDEKGWFKTLKKTFAMRELVERHSTIMDRYDPEKRVALVVDEWGTWYDVEPGTNPGFLYQQNTLRDALVAGINLNIFNNRADRVRVANIAQMINVLQAVILTQDDKMILTPTYHVFDLYKVHQDATLLPTVLQGDNYQFQSEAIPALSASASRDSAGRIHVTVCNLDPGKSRRLLVDARGASVSKVSGQLLTADAINAYNSFDRPNLVAPVPFSEAKVVEGKVETVVPPKSVVALELQ
jgi:alpha-N-arabinofuranosidase